MIKKSLSLLMCFILIFSLTSCNTYSNVDTKNENTKSTYTVDTSDLEAIGKKYVDFVYTGGTALYKSWDTPNKIDPYNLFISFCYEDTKKIKSSEKIIDLKTNAAYYSIDTFCLNTLILIKKYLKTHNVTIIKQECYIIKV